jgi:hypothetical protein
MYLDLNIYIVALEMEASNNNNNNGVSKGG